MSLSSILSSYGFKSSLSSGSAGAQAATAAAKLAAAKIGNATTVKTGIGKTVATGDTAVISAAALAKADNAKDFTALSKEVRETLDKQYAAGAAKGAPILSKLSGRALAAVALNKSGNFSVAESAAAKTVLRNDTRSDFTSAMSSGGGISGLATYSKQVVSEYDGMSVEERQARGWTDKFRASNATFATTASMPTLFDHFD